MHMAGQGFRVASKHFLKLGKKKPGGNFASRLGSWHSWQILLWLSLGRFCDELNKGSVICCRACLCEFPCWFCSVPCLPVSSPRESTCHRWLRGRCEPAY